MTNHQAHPFEALDQDQVMNAIESHDYLCDGRTFPLNSYENRVYQVGIENSAPIIAKFYRPERWTKEQILEEHTFSFELLEQELPIVAPLTKENKNSLFEYNQFQFALFPRKGGQAPDLDNPKSLTILGRLLGRIHAIGATKSFKHRHQLTLEKFGILSTQFISENFIPPGLKLAYDSLVKDVLELVEQQITQIDTSTYIRVHGDCHSGNILWRDNAPHFVDLDDTITAPAVQDIWMLLSGDKEEQKRLLGYVLKGYLEFCDFNPRELVLIEALRTLRIMNFSAWIARRWEDPAFPMHFPWFNTERYWSDHILTLREQFAALQEPPLPFPKDY